jgi:hypothetical protein
LGAFEVTEAARSRLEIPEIDFCWPSEILQTWHGPRLVLLRESDLPKLLLVKHRWIKRLLRHAPLLKGSLVGKPRNPQLCASISGNDSAKQ